MMRLRHYYKWLTSRDYRLHYWLGKHYSQHKFSWTLIPSVFYMVALVHGVEYLETLHFNAVEDRRSIRMRKILDEVIARIRGAE